MAVRLRGTAQKLEPHNCPPNFPQSPCLCGFVTPARGTMALCKIVLPLHNPAQINELQRSKKC